MKVVIEGSNLFLCNSSSRMITTGAVTRPQMRVPMGSIYYPYSTKLALLASLPTDPDLFQPGPSYDALSS